MDGRRVNSCLLFAVALDGCEVTTVEGLSGDSDLAARPLVRDRYPAPSQAVLAGTSGQLRNAATTGGNLLQRTRCP